MWLLLWLDSYLQTTIPFSQALLPVSPAQAIRASGKGAGQNHEREEDSRPGSSLLVHYPTRYA
jgi:hypothetical protein